MEVKVKLLTPHAEMPQFGTEGAAGADLKCTKTWEDEDGNIVYGTGIAMEIPIGCVGLLFPRSSVSRKDLSLTNCVGVIDSDYRGEIMMKFKPTPASCQPSRDSSGRLINSYRPEPKVYEVGDRIGQIIIITKPFITYVEADELSETGRGTGGYGSTGR